MIEKLKTIIIKAKLKNKESNSISESEIYGLARTLGLKVTLSVKQEINEINNATFIGTGKLNEIKELIAKEKINLALFDFDLTPAQQNNIEEVLNIKILDRTAVILEIFATRAKTKEAKMEVELAQLNYLLPRLKGKGVTLSRLAGGIGTRGPGETKLETDRRKIKDRIKVITKKLVDVETNRNLHRVLRNKQNIPQISILGYTNAGKSTLINALTNASSFVENKLFATLETKTKKLKLASKKHAIITDTVGFIDKLPHHLVKSFKSTFEEIKESDLIIHVIDISDENFHKKTLAVKEVLESISITNIPSIYVYNKIDAKKISKETFLKYPKQIPFVMMSAIKKQGIEDLIKKINEILSNFWQIIKIEINDKNSSVTSFAMSVGNVLKTIKTSNKVFLEIEVPKKLVTKIKKLENY
jgi:GTPase